MGTWAAWVRATYVIDETAAQLLRLIVEAGIRYQQARARLDTEGLTLNGRVHPAVAVERDSRAALLRLIAQLDLEQMHEDSIATNPTSELRRFPRIV
ncbi:MAG: hypothetical protein AB7N65_06020 [Vicinamibacterales bacterium]